jgi:hypothetical protein
MRKRVPEVIELFSTEEDEIHEDIDLTVLTEDINQKNDEKKVPQQPLRTFSSDSAHNSSVDVLEKKLIDIYIPRSKFNIHLVEDSDIPESRNILLNHQIKESDLSLSITIQDGLLTLNEVNYDKPKEELSKDDELILQKGSPQTPTENLDEFFSANEGNDGENNETPKDMSVHEDTDESLTSDDEETDDRKNESQAEPLDTNIAERSFAQSIFEMSMAQDEESGPVKEKSDVSFQADDASQLSENNEESGAEDNSVDVSQSDGSIEAQDDNNDHLVEINPDIDLKDSAEVSDDKESIKLDNEDEESKNDDEVFEGPESSVKQDESEKQNTGDLNGLSFAEAIVSQHDSQKSLDLDSDKAKEVPSENPKSNNEVDKFFSHLNASMNDDSKNNETESGGSSSSVHEEDEDPILVGNSKEKIDNVMKNDMFAYVSSSDTEDEIEASKESINVSVQPVKRKADESSEDENDDLDAFGSKRQKSNANKSMSEVEMFFSDNLNDDDIFNVEKSQTAQKNTNPKDAKKALAALMPSLSSTQVVKRRSTLIPSVSKSPSIVSSEKSVSATSGGNVPVAKGDATSNATSSNNDVSNKSIDGSDEKVKVTFISQLTGFSKCIVIVSLKRKKTLRSITDKIIKTIMKQKPGTAYTYSSEDCSFYHKGVKLNKFNTIADLQKGPPTENVEITIVSADVEKDLFKTSYEKMKSIELEEGKLKKLYNQMETVDANYNKIDEELRQMETVTAEKYTEEIGEVEAVAEEEDAVDDGKFSIKLLDKFNTPMVIKVTGDMTIADVLQMYKKDNKRAEGYTVVIMFDGDVVDLTDTLEDLGLEDDDMLEFVLK